MASAQFLADHMLMKLARWLRLAGQDVANPPPRVDDDCLMAIAKQEGRILLTRDVILAQRCKKAKIESVLIRSSDLESQLGEMRDWGLPMKLEPVRCTLCNGELVEVTDAEMRAKVPHLGEDAALWGCKSCGKLYWEGSHWKKIRERMERSE